MDRWQVFVKSIHTLVDNALKPGADASRADAQLALAKTQWYQAQAGEQAALATLAALMGMAGTEVQTEPGNLVQLPPVAALPRVAPADNPLARDQMAAVRQVEAQEKVLNRTDYPRIFLGAEAFGRGSEIPNNGSIAGNWDGLAPGTGKLGGGADDYLPKCFRF